MNAIGIRLSGLNRKTKFLIVILNDFFFALVCWLVFGPPMATYIASEFSTGIFEIFADELSEIEMQAFEIGSWGKNVNVKIPITNTKKQSTTPIIQKLLHNNIACNVTAIFTIDQIKKVLEVANKKTNLILSIFSGRIADSGIDPVPLCAEAVSLVKNFSNIEILWASTRELLNIFHAEQSGCNIITVPDDLLKKLSLIGKNLEDYSLETVLMFYNDAQKAGYKIF